MINIIDDSNRVAVAQEISMSMPAERVIKTNEINILYTLPGCLTHNSYIERFNGSYRRAVLDAYIFRNLAGVKDLTEAWMDYHNAQRPHESLDNMTPFEYREMKRVG